VRGTALSPQVDGKLGIGEARFEVSADSETSIHLVRKAAILDRFQAEEPDLRSHVEDPQLPSEGEL
jgi:hypothetical protein